MNPVFLLPRISCILVWVLLCFEMNSCELCAEDDLSTPASSSESWDTAVNYHGVICLVWWTHSLIPEKIFMRPCFVLFLKVCLDSNERKGTPLWLSSSSSSAGLWQLAAPQCPSPFPMWVSRVSGYLGTLLFSSLTLLLTHCPLQVEPPPPPPPPPPSSLLLFKSLLGIPFLFLGDISELGTGIFSIISISTLTPSKICFIFNF